MEASKAAVSDPFATGSQPGEEDPFAQADPSSFGGEEGLAAEIGGEEIAGDIPTVDREGQPVEAQTPVQASVAEARAAEERKAEARAAERQKAEDVAAQPAEEPAAPAQEPAEAPEAPEQPVEAQEPPQTASAPQTPPPATQPEQAQGELRRYKILYQTAAGQWTEADLSKAQALGIQTFNEEGEVYVGARNADHARRLAWSLLGRPEGGVTVNAVAQNSWKPKRIRPATPKPDRERLEIS